MEKDPVGPGVEDSSCCCEQACMAPDEDVSKMIAEVFGGEQEPPPAENPNPPQPPPTEEPEKPVCACELADSELVENLINSIFDETELPDLGEDEPCGCEKDCVVSDEVVSDMIAEVFDEKEEPPDEPPSEEPPDQPPEEPPVCKPPSSTIMNDVKKFCGVFADYEVFDLDFMMNINNAFFVLSELGVGPKEAFVVTDSETGWDAFIEAMNLADPARANTILAGVKPYVFLKTRKLFDPPTSTSILNSIDSQIAELEWRLRELCSGWLDEEEDEGEACDCDPADQPPEEAPPEDENPPPDENECPCDCEEEDNKTVEDMLNDVFGEDESPEEEKG